MNLLELKDKVLSEIYITKEEAMELYNINLVELLQAADEIKNHYCGRNIDLCTIINGKSGRCSEDCKYCAQSVHFKTGVNEYRLMKYEDILKAAEENYREGVGRFSIVTSGRALKGEDFEIILEYYKNLSKQCDVSLCASHGLLSYRDFKKLKECGVNRYHHNLETSKSYFNNICTTHSYEDKIATIKAAQEAGLQVCSGGIIGMGETLEDRINMAFELKELGIFSIPINILMAIEGTPFEKLPPLEEEDILKTISIFRFINPKAQIRLAGGRSLLSNCGQKAFQGGANATITGNLLTTCGNNIAEDMRMFNELGLEV